MTTTTTTTPRTFTARNGKSVVSSFSDAQALEICATLQGFGAELAAKPFLSAAQFVWVHILAVEAQTPKAPVKGAQIANFSGIISLFETAALKLKKAKIRLSLDGQTLALKPAPKTGKNAGFIYVTDGGDYENAVYFGKVSPSGEFQMSRNCPAKIADYLQTFADNPAKVAADYGKMTGVCCFCARELTDERSTSVGYGKICAANWGNLPWG